MLQMLNIQMSGSMAFPSPWTVSSLEVSGWTVGPDVMAAGTLELKLNLIPVSDRDTF